MGSPRDSQVRNSNGGSIRACRIASRDPGPDTGGLPGRQYQSWDPESTSHVGGEDVHSEGRLSRLRWEPTVCTGTEGPSVA